MRAITFDIFFNNNKMCELSYFNVKFGVSDSCIVDSNAQDKCHNYCESENAEKSMFWNKRFNQCYCKSRKSIPRT